MLCTTGEKAIEAFTMPPAPPKMNDTMASTCAVMLAFPHGRRRTQPIRPRPPWARAASSSDAAALNAVSRLGTATRNVRNMWMIFQLLSTFGSAYW